MQEIRTKLNDSREKFKDLVVCFGENPLHCVCHTVYYLCILCRNKSKRFAVNLRMQPR
jgi:hypothetical protein